jgi:hypothetical protein
LELNSSYEQYFILIGADEARRIGTALGINWDHVDLEQFRMGLSVELES